VSDSKKILYAGVHPGIFTGKHLQACGVDRTQIHIA